MNDHQLLCYSRQILLPQIGISNQQKLLDSTVLIVGAGGLGCSAAQYLCGSGIGRLIIVDDDRIALSNLPRQIAFSENDIGKYKATVLCQTLNQRLSNCLCKAKIARFSPALFTEILSERNINLVVDAGDNLEVTYLADQLSSQHNIPLVHAAVSRMEGHVYSRLPLDSFPALSTLFPQNSSPETCTQRGVMTGVVGIIAAYQAWHGVRILLQPELGSLQPELHLFDGKNMRWMTIAV